MNLDVNIQDTPLPQKNYVSQSYFVTPLQVLNSNISSGLFSALVMALFLILSFWKMHSFLLEGRFWAEEGVHFYTDISKLESFWSGLSYLFHGHLEIVTNLLVLLSTKVDFQFAPLVTTYLSFLLQFIPVAFVVLCHRNLGLSRFHTFLFVVVITGLAQSAEVWANSINLHFHFAVLAALLAVFEPKTSSQKLGSSSLIAICGLSGIPANFLVPVFVLKAIFVKSRISLIHALILTATALTQISLLLSHQLAMGNRQIILPPLITWYAVVAQQIWSPLAGFQIFKDAIIIMHNGIFGSSWLFLGGLMIAMLGTLPILYFSSFAIRHKHKVILLLIGSSVSLALMSVLTALGEKLGLVSEFGAGRYFFASNFLGCLVFFVFASKRPNWMIRIFSLVLVLSCFSRVDNMFIGPPWSLSLKEARESNSPEITIWPDGWQMANPEFKKTTSPGP